MMMLMNDVNPTDLIRLYTKQYKHIFDDDDDDVSRKLYKHIDVDDDNDDDDVSKKQYKHIDDNDDENGDDNDVRWW